jgi:hypothetical protein
MKPFLLFVLSFAFSGCALLEGNFGMEGEDGDKYECVENLDKCVKRCEVITKEGKKYYKEFNLPPEQCEKEQKT